MMDVINPITIPWTEENSGSNLAKALVNQALSEVIRTPKEHLTIDKVISHGCNQSSK